MVLIWNQSIISCYSLIPLYRN